MLTSASATSISYIFFKTMLTLERVFWSSMITLNLLTQWYMEFFLKVYYSLVNMAAKSFAV